jgi:hypothetical protein
MRSWWKSYIVPAMVVVGVAAVGGISLAVSAEDPFCSQSTDNMDPVKAQSFQDYCANATLWATNPPGPKNGPPSGPGPTAADLLQQMKLNADYGVSQVPPPDWLKAHQIGNVWLGDNNIVYAGAVGSDHSKGLVALASRWTAPEPEQLGIYTTDIQDGALQVVSAAGANITLVAENGAQYTFNTDSRTLTRN